MTDYTLVKLNNARTILVSELKFGIKEVAALNAEFAQLFMEVHYVVTTDKAQEHHYTDLIAILADHLIWHILLLDISKQPYIIKSYVCVIKGDLEIDKICHYLHGLINNIH